MGDLRLSGRLLYEAWRVSRRMKPAKSGNAELRLYKADGLTAIRAAFKGENIQEGDEVLQLLVSGQLWMSDSSDEFRSHLVAIRRACGRVLIHGLGLGCYLSAILTKPEVEHVDVVELNPDVLALVSPYFKKDKRVRFHLGNAFTFKWPKGAAWNCVWHDIWNDKCSDDLEEHATLLRKFGKRAGWQGCWAHEELLYYRRREA